MPWPLVFYPEEQMPFTDANPQIIGACWYEEAFLNYKEAISPKYLKYHVHRRLPLVVKLPDGTCWCVDLRARNEAQGWYGDGWGVIGDPPNLSVSPSINIPGRYHGFIHNGILSDDCEGRKFP